MLKGKLKYLTTCRIDIDILNNSDLMSKFTFIFIYLIQIRYVDNTNKT